MELLARLQQDHIRFPMRSERGLTLGDADQQAMPKEDPYKEAIIKGLPKEGKEVATKKEINWLGWSGLAITVLLAVTTGGWEFFKWFVERTDERPIQIKPAVETIETPTAGANDPFQANAPFQKSYDVNSKQQP